jgi:hypothetical protein
MIPIAAPGAMTERERFMFDTFGYLVIPDALSASEVAGVLEASRRAHSAYPGRRMALTGSLVRK